MGMVLSSSGGFFLYHLGLHLATVMSLFIRLHMNVMVERSTRLPALVHALHSPYSGDSVYRSLACPKFIAPAPATSVDWDMIAALNTAWL